jgi:hypothetical protein
LYSAEDFLRHVRGANNKDQGYSFLGEKSGSSSASAQPETLLTGQLIRQILFPLP